MDKEITNGTDVAEETAAQAPGAQTVSAEKTFTQAEVDALIAARLARDKKGMPDKAELAEFRKWKSSQQTEEEKLTAAQRERDEARDEAEQYKRQLFLAAQGVPVDDLEYYAYKIGKLTTGEKDFETAAGEYLREHPVKKAAAAETPDAGKDKGKEDDAGKDKPAAAVRFTTKMGASEGPKTKEDIMAIKDRKVRRAMIAENFDLFKSGKEK